jgi:hypothetical protein
MAEWAIGPALPPRRNQAITATVVPFPTPAERACFLRLQALEDAISYRLARLATPCPGCGPQRCDDHAVDIRLIADYRDTARQLSRALHTRR